MIINSNLSSTKDEYQRASGGMKKPQVTKLNQGQELFRFASTRNHQTGAAIPSANWAEGAWWFQKKDYELILSRFKSGQLPLGTVGRMAGAVQPSWSNMDVSIKAVLLHDIFVYIGKGSTQYRDQLPNGWFITAKGWPEIDQIYIPNMRKGARNALHILRQKIIQTNDFGF